jgi:hypothetical protein
MRISRLIGVACILTGSVLGFSAPAAAAGSAGTSVGNAGVVIGKVTGAITSGSQNDWWVVYPKKATEPIKLKLTNTTRAGSGCLTVGYEVFNETGTNGPIDGPGPISDGKTLSYQLSGSSNYYILVNSAGGCSPPSGQPLTYSLDVGSGAGSAPHVPGGKRAPGRSIGSVSTPLSGDTLYTGSVVGAVTDDWYVFYKTRNTNVLTVRLANTTVQGSTNCPSIGYEIDAAEGTGQIVYGPTTIGDNAIVYDQLTQPGEYYILVNSAGNCAPSPTGPKFSIELEPKSEVTGGPTPSPAVVRAKPSLSMGTARSPLRGDTVYNGTVPTGTINDWYQLDKIKATGLATVRLADTTVRGSSSCSTIGYEVENASGSPIDGPASLPDNAAVAFSFTTAAKYYLLVNSAGGCSPSPAGLTYSIEPEPAPEWSKAPTVTGVSPRSGPSAGGTKVTITGIQLTGATGVVFGKVAATSFTVISATKIQATSPPQAAGSCNIRVTTSHGTNLPVSADKFTYLPSS